MLHCCAENLNEAEEHYGRYDNVQDSFPAETKTGKSGTYFERTSQEDVGQAARVSLGGLQEVLAFARPDDPVDMRLQAAEGAVSVSLGPAENLL